MMDIWTEREPREKWLIGVAAAMAVLFFGWQFGLKPLLAWPGEQKARLEQVERDLEVAREGKLALGQSQGQGAPKRLLAGNAASTHITSSAEKIGLNITRRQPNGTTGLTLWLEDVDSKLMYSWLTGLTGQYNVTVQGANLNRNDDGTVQAQLSFGFPQ